MYRPLRVAIDTGNGSPRRQATIIGLVVALHALLIYSIVTGLAAKIVLAVPNVINAQVLPPQKIEQPLPVPATTKPELVEPSLPTVPVPVIRIARETPPRASITAVQGPPRPIVRTPVVSVAPPVPPTPVIAPTEARTVAGTHTTPLYPELSRRLGEAGTVRLNIALDASGAVGAVAVVISSGSERLDAAAVEWVTAHWRYHPATEGGKPVASSVLAEVVFDLKHAR